MESVWSLALLSATIRTMSHDLSAHRDTKFESSFCSIEDYRFTGARSLEAERHDNRQIGILLEGHFQSTGTSDFETPAASVVLYPSESTAGADFSDCTQHFLWLTFKEEWKHWPGERETYSGRPALTRTGAVHQTACRLATILAGPDAGDRLLLDGYIEALLTALTEIKGNDTDPSPRWLSALLDQIAENGMELDLASLAASAGVHPSHLSRSFKAKTGLTVGEHRRWLRIHRGARMLRKPDRSVAEIAMTCGFHDQAHFCRTFKAATGYTPSGFRASA